MSNNNPTYPNHFPADFPLGYILKNKAGQTALDTKGIPKHFPRYSIASEATRDLNQSISRDYKFQPVRVEDYELVLGGA